MEQRGHDMVVIGGSLGAMDPLKTLLSQLPAQPRASLFVTLHVSDQGSGILQTVLSGVNHLPVHQAEHGMHAEQGHVYLAIPDHHLLITENGTLQFGQGPRENMVRPSIDALFRSAALAYGPRVIGVLLSGMLNDGVSGLEAIKRCGGITMVQDPDDAVAGDLPRNALRAMSVDVTGSASELSDAIRVWVERPAGNTEAAPNDIRLDVQIAAGERTDSYVMPALAAPAPLTCPSCGGVMSQIGPGTVLRFRCQVGHAMTAEVLAKQQEDAVDEALRVALRMMEERAELVTRMASDNRRSNRDAVAEIYEQRATEYRNYADVLRRAVLGPAGSTAPSKNTESKR